MSTLTVLLARGLNPFVWRWPGHAGRKLHGFALAEQGSMLDMRIAASRTTSPQRAAAYLRHADDEARHAQMFARRARKLAGDLGPLMADCEQLFDALGELDFLAFVHTGEARALGQFETYVAWFTARGREQDRVLFETIMVDERRHSAYTRELLLELAGSEAAAKQALRRVARWELGRRWLRAGRFVAERVYVLTMLIVYVLAAPLSLLVRAARPIRRGWRTPAASE